MALEDAYRTFEAPGTYNPGEIHEGPYRRLETLRGEVAMEQMMGATQETGTIRNFEGMFNPINPAGVGVMGM
jgi:hypothetical protein